MVSAAKFSTSARDLSREPTAYTAFQNSTSHTVLRPRIMEADGVVFLCSFQDNVGPVVRARRDWGADQWAASRTRARSGDVVSGHLCDVQMQNLVE